MFYKVNSLAVDKDIALISQVLLDDGNRIIIPQGNFKVQYIYYDPRKPARTSNIVSNWSKNKKLAGIFFDLPYLLTFSNYTFCPCPAYALAPKQGSDMAQYLGND